MTRIYMAILGLTVISAAAEDMPVTEFLWRQAVQGEIVSGRLYRAKVSDQIFDRCQAFPVDVRIMESSGRDWPFFLWSPPGEVESVALNIMGPDPKEQKQGVQTLLLDVGVRNRPLQMLRLFASDTNFALPAKVFGRNAETNSWRWVGDGGVHRMEDQVREAIALRGCAYRWLKVELYHYEGAPLNVTNVTAEATPNYFIFEAQGEDRPFIYFASSTHVLPYYNLQKKTTERDVAEASLVELGRRQMNPQRLAIGLGRYGHWLTVAAGVVVGALVLIVVVRRFR